MYIEWLHDAAIGFDPDQSKQLAQAEENHEDKTWKVKTQTLGDIRPGWMAEYLLKRSKKLRIERILNEKVMKQLIDNDPQDVRNIFCMDVQLPMSFKMSAEMQDAKVAAMTFDQRATEVGGRLADWVRDRAGLA